MSNNRNNPPPPPQPAFNPALMKNKSQEAEQKANQKASSEQDEANKKKQNEEELQKRDAYFRRFARVKGFSPKNDPWKRGDGTLSYEDQEMSATLTAGKVKAPRRDRRPGIYKRFGHKDLYWDGEKVTVMCDGRSTVRSTLNAIDFLASIGVGECVLDWPPDVHGRSTYIDLDLVAAVLLRAKLRNPPTSIILGDRIREAIHMQYSKYGYLITRAEKIKNNYDVYMQKILPPQQSNQRLDEKTKELDNTEKPPKPPVDRKKWMDEKLKDAKTDEERLTKIHEQVDNLEKKQKTLEEASAELEKEQAEHQKVLNNANATPEQKQEARDALEDTEESRKKLETSIERAKENLKQLTEAYSDEMKDPRYEKIQAHAKSEDAKKEREAIDAEKKRQEIKRKARAEMEGGKPGKDKEEARPRVVDENDPAYVNRGKVQERLDKLRDKNQNANPVPAPQPLQRVENSGENSITTSPSPTPRRK